MSMLDLEMNALDIARSVAHLGVNWLIQSSLLIVAGLWLGSALRSKGSAAQSAVYRTTLVAVLVCPLVSWGLAQFGATGWSLEMPAAYTQEEVFSPLPQDADTRPAVELEPIAATGSELPAFETSANTARLESSYPNEFPVNEPAVDFAPPAATEEKIAAVAPVVTAPIATVSTNWFGISAIVAGALWLLTGGWLLARLAHSWHQLIRLRRTAMAADAATIETCRNVAKLFRVEPPAVLHSPFLPSPCLAGLHRPVVLLPDDDLSLPMRDVLIHELAHLARGDCYWNLLRRIGTSLLFFQPLMWLLSRRLDSTAEEVCDDYVVQFGGNRREYAHRLVDIAELSVAPIAAAGVGIVSLRSMLAARVARIMDTSRSLSTRVGHALLAIVLLCGLLGTILAGLVGVGPGNETVAADAATTSTKEASSENTPAVAADAPKDESELQAVRGRVVDHDGNPIAGAHITAAQLRWLDERWVATERRQVNETHTGMDGSFEITVPKVEYPDFGKNRLVSFGWKPVTITATAPGHAAAWIGGDWYRGSVDPLAGEVTLQLKKESSTIRGRLVNLEGQPQAGLSVKVMSLGAAEPGKVDEWLAAVEQLRKDGKLPRASSYSYFATAMVASMTDDTIKDQRSAYFPTKWRLYPGDPNLTSPVRSDSEGRFELAGMPPDCLAVLQISGPGVATQSVSVVTRPMSMIDVANTGFAGDDAHGYHGVEFDHAMAPGTAIFGRVTDTETGTPLSGMQVTASAISPNRMLISRAAWTARTDEKGRYRIEGLPIEGEKRVSVTPTPDQPYLSAEDVKIKDTNEVEPLEINIKLRRGVVVRGKVTVAETGEPVDATLHYHPFLNNDFAKQYNRYDPRVYRYEGNDIRHRTGADGSFQTVVIPGRGILGAYAIASGEFCTGLGGEDIETNEEGRFLTFNIAFPRLYQRILTIDVPPDAREVEYNLTVSRGIKLKYAVNDPQGQPLTGVLASDVSSDIRPADTEPAQATVEFKSLRPGEKRRVILLHRERRLGRVLEIVAPAAVQPEVPPQSVTLLPCGAVEGRLINGEGEPISGIAIAAYAMPLSELANVPQQVTTDANGAFRLEYLPIGASYRIVGTGQEYGSVDLFDDLRIEPGEKVDAGTIDVTKKERPEPKRMMSEKRSGETASRIESAAPPTASRSPRIPNAITVRGRVLGEDGEPVAGATVQLSDDEATELQAATSGLDGRFEIEFDKARFTKPDWHQEAWRFARLLVTADSFAPAWLEGKDLISDKEFAVQLKRDDLPIRGQVLTLEGQPVPNARLVIWDVHQPNSGSLDGMFESLRESPLSMQLQSYRNTEMSWFRGRSLELKVTRGTLIRTADGSIVTADAEGRFEFTGIGPERLARGRIEGENIQSVEMSIATRSTVDDWWKRESLGGDARMRLESGDRLPQIYPSTFEHFASPSSSITGVVLDRATGQRLAGIGVSGGIRGSGDHATGVTDEIGRYELTGLAVDGMLRLFVGSNDAAQLPYIGVEREIEITAGSSPKPEDTRFTLTRGIVVRGTVTDVKTGGPVKARVEYIAHGSNPLVAQIGDRIYPYGGSLTNDRGEYAVVALPGRGALGGTTNLAAGVSDHYRPVQAEDFGLPLTDEGWINTANHGTIMPIHYTAATFLDLKPDEESRVVPLAVKPMFEVASVQCVDGQGQPLKKVSVIGQFPWNGKSRVVPGGGKEVGPDSAKYFQIANLEEHGRQPAIFMHRGTNSAAILFGSKSAQQPRLVDLHKLENGLHQLTLKPVAIVTGKVVDGKGAPVDRASVELRLITNASPTDPTVEVVRSYTNAIGRFKMEFVPAGGPYLLTINGNDAAGGIAKRDIVLEPEQFLNLDRIDITKLQSPESKQAAEKTAASDAATMNLHGRVIGPNVEPAAGANVAVIGASNRQRRGGDLDYRDEVLAETTTNADGTYQLSLAGISSKTHTRTVVVALADGAAMSWQNLDPDSRTKTVSFELLSEEPIRGQLVDIEGQLAAGVRMSIAAVMPTSKDEKYTNGVGFRDFSAAPAAWPKTITTDADGRFVIHGIPARHGVFINVAGSDRFAPQQISLNSGMPEQRGERDGTYRALVKNLKPGEEAVLALAPAQIFEGVVRYEDTNQPAPHARLTIWASQQKFGSMISVPGKADAQGRYRISPNPGIRFGVTAYPPDGTPYLTRELPAVDWDDAAKVKQVDVTLPRGVLVRGKVLESTSGAPVAGATVQYVPEDANNPNDADDILTGWQGIQLSNERGEFEIVVLPGPGNLLVHGPQGEFVLRETSDRQLSRGRPGGRRNYANAIERVDPPDGAEPLDVTIRLQRGAKVAGQLVNEAGEPIDEAILISQLNTVATTLSWRGDANKQVLGGSFELSPLEPNQKYTVHFLDAKRRLGATATLTTEDVAPTVILKPCGQATARFVDAAGQALADFRSSLHMAVSPGASEYDFKAAERGELAADADFVSNIDRTNHWHLPPSDKDGRITFPALIPGAIYRITLSEIGDSKEFSVESGQSLDLGQIVIDREQ